MTMIRKRMLKLILFVMILLNFYPLLHSVSNSMDIVLLIDSSGTMASTDPSNLRLQAAKSFVDLANVGDRIGVIDFSTTSKTLAIPTIIDREEDKKTLKNYIESIGSQGEMTDILTALNSAFQLLKTNPGRSIDRAVILLTDGKLELPDFNPNYGRESEAIEKISKMYRGDNIKIISVGFTKVADMNLLDKFARESGGRVYLAQKDTELLKVYTDIFADLKKLYRTFEFSATLSPQSPFGKEILVDKYVKEITFAVNRSDSSIEIEVLGSDGKPVSETNTSNVCISEARSYKIVRAFKPSSGNWKVYIKGLGSAYGQVISITDLLLELSTLKNSFGIHEPIKIDAYLMLENNKISDSNFFANAEFKLKVKRPDGIMDEIQLFDNGENSDLKAKDGIYSISYAGPALEGEYVLYGEAGQKDIFDRRKDIRINRGAVFKFLTSFVNIGDVVKGENGVCDLKAISSYAENRVFTPSFLTFIKNGEPNGEGFESPSLQPKEITFPPGKDSRAYVYMNTGDLPYGMYEGKLKLIEKSFKDVLFVDFKMNVVPLPPPPNHILSIIKWIISVSTLLYFILLFYKKRIPKFSGALVWESEGSSQRFMLIGSKRWLLGMFGIRSCKIIIGSSSSADIRLFAEGIEPKHIFLKAEKDSSGRKTNIAAYLIAEKEAFVNDEPLILGCRMVLKHDDVINIGGQKLRFEDFNREVEGVMLF